MKTFPFACLLLVLLTGCSVPTAAPVRNDPYPGNGGVYLATPTEADIMSGHAVYDPPLFESLRVGVTTKWEVVNLLGKPAWWQTKPDGTSILGYDYVGKRQTSIQQIKRATLSFGPDLVLKDKQYTGP